jgi:hypothetical protein
MALALSNQIAQSKTILNEDLNGDGVKEKISIILSEDKFHYTLKVNNAKINGFAEYIRNEIRIIDIDTTDSFKEIVVYADGPSDDPTTAFFQYNGKKIIFLGEVQGNVGVNEKLNGDKFFTTTVRGAILHTWFHPEKYKLISGQKIIKIPQDLYKMGTKVTMASAFNLQKSRTNTKKACTLAVGDKVTIVASDDKNWCMIKNAKGVTGWFNMAYLKSFNTVPFIGLCNAD